MTEAGGTGPRTPADLAGQLRAAADRIMAGWSATTGSAGMPAGLPPMPATASAQQLQALLDDLAARRAQIQALRAQLEGFDEQLASLETSLRPMLEWTRTWASMESALGNLWRPPGGGSST